MLKLKRRKPDSISKNPNVKAQKDTDACWTKKNNVSYFGYKNHTKVDSKSKIITQYTVTPANEYDSQALEDLLDQNTDAHQPLYADSAYTGEEQEKTIAQAKMENQVCKKAIKIAR